MRRSLAAASAAILSVLLIAATPGSACACSCVEQTDAEAFEAAAAVFIGTLTGVDEAGLGNDRVTLEFEVDAVYKGDIAEVQGVRTAGSEASCGWEPTEGERYLVFASSGDGELATGLCSGSRLDEAAAPAFAADPAAPADGESGLAPISYRPYAAGAAALIAVGAAAWILLRRRRG